MVKSSKKSKVAPAPEMTPIVPQSETRNGNGPSQAGLIEPKAKAGKAGKATVRAKAPGSKPRKTAIQRKGRATQSVRPLEKPGVSVSDDEIRLRAYFIAERRVREGLPGDSSHDWLEARRQLVAEAEGHA
jgi:hypothetical protein